MRKVIVSGASTSTSLGMSVGQARVRPAERTEIGVYQAQRLGNNQYTFQVHPQASRKKSRAGRFEKFRPRYK